MIGKALVIGGGVGGMSAALALARRGHRGRARRRRPAVARLWRGYQRHRAFAAGIRRSRHSRRGARERLRRRRNPACACADGSRSWKRRRCRRTRAAGRPQRRDHAAGRCMRSLSRKVRAGRRSRDAWARNQRVRKAAGRRDGRRSPTGAANATTSSSAPTASSSRRARRCFPRAPAPRFTGQGCWRIVAERPPEVDRAEMYLGGPVKLGFNPVSRDKMYTFILEHVPDNRGLRRRAACRTCADCWPVRRLCRRRCAKASGPDSLVNYRPLEWVCCRRRGTRVGWS